MTTTATSASQEMASLMPPPRTVRQPSAALRDFALAQGRSGSVATEAGEAA
jgi:hypothetical protein